MIGARNTQKLFPIILRRPLAIVSSSSSSTENLSTTHLSNMRIPFPEAAPTRSEPDETNDGDNDAPVESKGESLTDKNDPLEKGEFIIRNDTGDIPADSGSSLSCPLIKDDWKKWNPLVILFALLIFVGVIVGIIVISQTERQTSTAPSSSNATSYYPSMSPNFSTIPESVLSRAPNANASSAPLPTSSPSKNPTVSPSSQPTAAPSESPTHQPSSSPSTKPSVSPSRSPTISPSKVPSEAPTKYPTQVPTKYPTKSPTAAPTQVPTFHPTHYPTDAPTETPTNAPTNSPTHDPTEAPTEAPTNAPTNTPTKFPTPPPSPSPSSKPTLTPTALPTLPKIVPINDVCTNAVGPLPSDFSSNFGTIANAGVDYIGVCGGFQQDPDPGVWYYTIGTGGEMMAHTCLGTTFNSKLTIFEGACGTPVCVEFNDDFCGSGTSQSAVSWDSVYGETYFILVTGNPDFEDGSFNLVVGARSNDECSTAIGPLAVDDPIPVLGSTIGATADYVSCDGVVNESNSVWYLVEGTGKAVTVNFCENTDFSAQITILTGSCTGIECVPLTAVEKCSVTWDSQLSQSYYILIGGQKAKDIGDFSLQLSNYSPSLAENDECKDAIGPLAFDGTPIVGSTALASPDTEAPFCFTAVTSNGLWYYVEGNGSTIQASLCDSQSYDTRISIYRGSCSDGLSDLACVNGNDDFCGKQSLVTWDSLVGVTYYIHVHGYSTESGDFLLTVTSLSENEMQFFDNTL